MGVHVESQLRGGTARVRGSGTAVLSIELADGVRAAAAITGADSFDKRGAGSVIVFRRVVFAVGEATLMLSRFVQPKKAFVTSTSV